MTVKCCMTAGTDALAIVFLGCLIVLEVDRGEPGLLGMRFPLYRGRKLMQVIDRPIGQREHQGSSGPPHRHGCSSSAAQ
jgi:hypothetical protein